ncbi:MAG TPA: [FeFe] hydrogenase H-cluster radical SAM maturase HydE [Tissierellia bacterium]|nr:[FeFe] hydrogenase H-cluster radical SAM maturase HydE [Tissierellia bacterium]
MRYILEKLYLKNSITREELLYLLDNLEEKYRNELYRLAYNTTLKTYGNRIFVRGLLEFTNYCRNNCKYCGLRRGNTKVERYRLSREEIFESLEEGNKLGYKTFVLQGGEDPYYTDEILADIIKDIKTRYKDVAVTLSIGERSRESYEKLYNAGADRFLLRHETATKEMYDSLHEGMSLEHRIECLNNLKEIGYQVGAGFIVGLPGETNEALADNLLFLKRLEPAMVGIGPFISHPDTPLWGFKNGSVETTLTMISLTRLLLPNALIPATTALNTLSSEGLEKGILAGANVVMLNLSPIEARRKYELYKGKEITDIHQLKKIEERARKVNFKVDMGRGDHINYKERIKNV